MKKFIQRMRSAWSLANWPGFQNMGGVSNQLRVPGIARPAENILMVYAALKARGDAIKQVPLRCSDAQDRLIESGPLAELLAQPNQMQDAVEYIEALEGYLTLFDEAFIAIVSDGGSATELIPLHPRGMTAVEGVHRPTGVRITMGWTYLDPFTGQATNFVNEDVIVITGFNPHAPLRGLGPDLAARRAFQADIAAREHNLGIFLNGGTPDVALETDQRWTKEQADEFMSFWQARYAGFHNAHKPAVLYGGLKVNKLGLTNADLQFLEGIRKTDQEILTAMRVYPAMVGSMLGETGLSQGSSTDSQKVAWWTDVGLPELARIASAHQRALAPRFGSAARGTRALVQAERNFARKAAISGRKAATFIWFDLNCIEALVEHRRARLDQFDKLLARGYLPNDLNLYFDLGLPEHPTNIGTLPIGVQNVTDLQAVSSQPSAVSQPAEPPRAIALLDGIRQHLGEQRAGLAAKWQHIRKGLDQLIATHEKNTAKKYSRFFVEQRERVLQRLSVARDFSANSVASVRNSADDLLQELFPLQKENEELLKRFAGLLQEQLQVGWKTINAEVGLPENANPFQIDDPHLFQALENRKKQCQKMNDTTRGDILKIVGDGLEQGLSTAEIGSGIADYYGQQVGEDSSRCRTAARIQVAGLVNDGRMAAARSAGNVKKGWLHGGSEHPRDSHVAAQSTYLASPIDLEEDFNVGGVRMSQPGAADAPIEEVANCTCMVVFSMTGGEA